MVLVNAGFGALMARAGKSRDRTRKDCSLLGNLSVLPKCLKISSVLALTIREDVRLKHVRSGLFIGGHHLQ
jgi:hypothetical protein